MVSWGCSAMKLTPEDIKSEVELTPEAPDFAQFLKPILGLGRRLRIAAPCTGIHGCGVALSHVMKVGCDSCYIYDLEPGYRFPMWGYPLLSTFASLADLFLKCFVAAYAIKNIWDVACAHTGHPENQDARMSSTRSVHAARGANIFGFKAVPVRAQASSIRGPSILH